MRRLPSLVALVALLLITACGTAAPAVTPTPTAPPTPVLTPSPTPTAVATPAVTATDLSDAADRTAEAGTAQMAIGLTFEGSRLMQEGMGMTGDGQVSFGEPRQFRMSMDMKDFGFGVVEVILDNRLLYIRGTAFDRLSGAGQWIVVDLDSKHPAAAEFVALGSGQNDNSLAVFYLYGADGPIRFLGAERLRGVDTTRVGVRLDLEKALERVPARAKAALEENINTILEQGVDPILQAEAWIGDDGYVHRVRYEYKLTAQMGGGRMIGVFDLSAFGDALDLKLPGTFEVVKLEDVLPAP